MRDWLRFVEHFRCLLAVQHAKRTERGSDWLAAEIDAMHAAINRERACHALSPVDRELVERADRSASGHVDYAMKFGLYCAELALQPRKDSP